MCDLPAPIARRLAEFAAARKTGRFELDVKDGRVIGWRIVESGRVDSR